MAVDTGDKAISSNGASEEVAESPRLDFSSIASGSEYLLTTAGQTDSVLPAGIASSDQLMRNLGLKENRVASIGDPSSLVGAPEKTPSDAQTMLTLTDPETKAIRDSFLNDPSKISEALKRVADNPNDPANRATEQALRVLRLDLKNMGYDVSLDTTKGEMQLTKKDLETGENQSLTFDRNGTDRDLNEFMDDTIPPPPEDIRPTVEMNRREARINSSLGHDNINPLLNAVKELGGLKERLGGRESGLLEGRIAQIQDMVGRVATQLSGDNPFHPVKAELNDKGQFELTLTRDRIMTISPEGQVQINGTTVKADDPEVRDFLTTATSLRRLTTNEKA
jgi:hypothetical protein